MQNILNLSRYNILTSTEGEHDYHIEAETAEPAVICRSCGSEDVLGGGRQEILIKKTSLCMASGLVSTSRLVVSDAGIVAKPIRNSCLTLLTVNA